MLEIGSIVSKYRDRRLAERIVRYISEMCNNVFLIMHVCGTQP